ncbi:MAG: DUF4012 domain-containing protein [Candidatus Levybacteria bacterium]|nr:DUF4012 domain-containing protein [Candidatus Levybacteria bacterium]
MATSSNSRPILIFDSEGMLGEKLAEAFSQNDLVLFVTKKEVSKKENVIPVPLQGRIPSIPNNLFSRMYVCCSGEKEFIDFLPGFVQKAKESSIPLVCIFSIFSYRTEIVKALRSLYEDVEIVVVGDIFSHRTYPSQTPVNSLLVQAEKGRVLLTNDGLDLLYPVFIDDVVDRLMSLPTVGEVGETYAMFPPHPITQLSFVRLLQKSHEHITVDYEQKPSNSLRYLLPTSAIPYVDTPYPLEHRIKKLQLSFSKTLSSPAVKKSKKKISLKKRGRKRIVFLAMSVFFFLLSLPLVLTALFSLMGGFSLQQVESHLSRGELSEAYASSKQAQTFFLVADEASSTLRNGASKIGLASEVDGMRRFVRAGKEISSAVRQLLSVGVIFQNGIGDAKGIPREKYIESINALKESFLTLQVLQAEDDLPQVYVEKIKKFEKPLGQLINVLEVSPQILGYDGKKQYLILFQNNFELRPSGGFIGSYGILVIDNGKIESFSIKDVYDADGKLTAEIDPPFVLERYMGASHWFLRDSNFSIDFPISANQAVSFLKLETGESVDGVIAVDVSFMAAILGVVGPIHVRDYNETVNKDNFYLLTQRRVENNFFPGSTQKKDFLRAFESSLFEKMAEGGYSYQQLFSVLIESALEKHILFAFSNNQVQSVFSVNHLSSSLDDTYVGKRGNVIDDVVGINEANIGQNKVNYYLHRSISDDVSIDGEGVISHILGVKYQNMSTDRSEFGGDYKAYLRFVMPSTAKIVGVDIDGQAQEIIPAITNRSVYSAASFKERKGIEIEEDAINDYLKTAGMYLVVPKETTKKVVIRYELDKKAPISQQEWRYGLQIIKQPGTVADSYSLTLRYPVDDKPHSLPSEVVDLGGKLVAEKPLLQDQHFLFTFVQK